MSVSSGSSQRSLKQDTTEGSTKKGFSMQEIASLLRSGGNSCVVIVMGVLSEDATQMQTFEQLASSLHHYFNNKSEYFKIGMSLVLMLQNPDLLPHPTQRLAAIYLMYEMYSPEPLAANPFAAIFVHLLNPPLPEDNDKNGNKKEFHWAIPKVTNSEKYFVSQLLSPTKELFKKTPKQILDLDVNTLPPIDPSGIQLSLVERQSEMPGRSKSAIPCIMSDPDQWPTTFEQFNRPGCINQDVQRQTLEAIIGSPNPTFDKYLRPEFIQLAPPLHCSLDEELVWMNPPVEEYLPQWDASLCKNSSVGTEVRRLMMKAFAGPLVLHQQQQLLSELEKNPSLVFHTGLTPGKLPDLVEANPLIAIEVLLKLMQSNQITEYLSVLVNMEMSLHSMEVVNRLTSAIELPSEFVYLYVSNCISTCETIKDRYMQNRLVRLVCVFLQSLIRNKIIDIKDIFIEIQAFCIEFSRIREAGGLFRLLKTLDGTEQSTEKPSTSNNSGGR